MQNVSKMLDLLAIRRDLLKIINSILLSLLICFIVGTSDLFSVKTIDPLPNKTEEELLNFIDSKDPDLKNLYFRIAASASIRNLSSVIKKLNDAFPEINALSNTQGTVSLATIINKKTGMNLLHTAAESGSYEVVQLLLEYGVNINEKSIEGNFPSQYVDQVNRPDLFQLLSNAEKLQQAILSNDTKKVLLQINSVFTTSALQPRDNLLARIKYKSQNKQRITLLTFIVSRWLQAEDFHPIYALKKLLNYSLEPKDVQEAEECLAKSSASNTFPSGTTKHFKEATKCIHNYMVKEKIPFLNPPPDKNLTPLIIIVATILTTVGLFKYRKKIKHWWQEKFGDKSQQPLEEKPPVLEKQANNIEPDTTKPDAEQASIPF